MMDEQWELHVIFRGRVQGVGFRWTIADHAERFKLTGATRNLPDGNVEIWAQGKKEDLDSFFKAIQAEPGEARIESFKKELTKPSQIYKDFRIVK